MAETTPEDLVDKASGRQLGGILASSIGGFIFSVAFGTISVVQVVFDLFTEPIGETISAVAAFMSGIPGGAARIVQQGVDTTIRSLAPGGAFAFGPLTFAEAVLVAGSGAIALAFILSLDITSNIVPFTATDIPIVNWFFETAEEEEGDQD